MAVNIPLTGTGQSTAAVATRQIGGEEYQYFKLAGSSNSTAEASVLATTPAASDGALVVRPIGSTGFTQAVVLTSGTSNKYQFMQSIPFSSGNIARTSVSTTIDRELIAANANRLALIIANRSTAQTVGIGFSTAVLTTALANVDCYIPPSSYLSFGLQGGLPLVRGPIRGINLTSTTLAGSVAVTEFT